MPESIRTANPFSLDKERFQFAIARVMSRISTGDIRSESEILREVFSAYIDLYKNLRDPEDVTTGLLDEFDIRDSEKLNLPFRAAEINNRFLSNMYGLLRRTQQNTFNYLSALNEAAKGSLARSSSLGLDLKLLTNTPRSDFIVGGDDFHDLSKVDLSAVPDGLRVEILPSGGVILKRTGIETITSDDIEDINIEGPDGLYEGKLYGLLKGALDVEPEGFAFRFREVPGFYQEKVIPGLTEELKSRFETAVEFFQKNPSAAAEAGLRTQLTPQVGAAIAASKGTFAGFTQREWEQIAGNFHYERSFSESRPRADQLISGKAVSGIRTTDNEPGPDNIKIIIDKGDEGEKKTKRLRMFDENPDTFWQAELVIDTSDEYNRWKYDELQGMAIPDVDYDKLKDDVQSTYDDDSKFLDVTISVVLKQRKRINFLSILPVHFDPTQVLEVISVQYSPDGATYIDVPEINQGRFERKLTEDVNAELSSEETAFSLSANKFDYAGQGLFGFNEVNAKSIKIKLREQRPVPTPYHEIRIVLERTVTIKKKKVKYGHTKRKTSVVQYSRDLVFDYPSTLQEIVGTTQVDADTTAVSGASNIDDVIREAGIGKVFVKRSSSTTIGSFTAGGLAVFNGKGLGDFKSRRRTRIIDHGWEVRQDPLLIPRFDKARYAIGLREIGLSSYLYSSVGSFYSKPFFSPKSIRQISIETDEVYPAGASFSTRLINYFFSVDDGTTWLPINPLRSGFSDNIAPQVYHVNSGIPNDQRDSHIGYIDTVTPALSVRVRADLQKPEGINSTPILRAYRVKMHVEGGL